MTSEMRNRFRDLHRDGCFVIPNPWDVGSAVRFEQAGALALATTSAGFAWSIGKEDREVTLDELTAHVEALVAHVGVPVHVDAEHCFDDPAATVGRLAAVGASGVSIEDFDPSAGATDDVATAAARVGAAAAAAHAHGITLTARADGFLHDDAGVDELVERLRAYRAAGADVVFAPGPSDPDVLRALIGATDAPSNVLIRPGGPTVAELAALGARRLSTGGALARTAYDAAVAQATALLDARSSAP
ncbi:MAG: isocitrate lyase/phosphoenolpyruvate mutase family protein [Acidimicrobiales bacterium]